MTWAILYESALTILKWELKSDKCCNWRLEWWQLVAFFTYNFPLKQSLMLYKETWFFMFCWPCISIYLCNKNQLEALFILNLFRQSTSTSFGHVCSSSSGGILCIYNTYKLLCVCVYIYIYIYIYIQCTSWWWATNMPEIDWRNKVRINSASSWFSLYGWNMIVFILVLFWNLTNFYSIYISSVLLTILPLLYFFISHVCIGFAGVRRVV
jgi:hypothetical protein